MNWKERIVSGFVDIAQGLAKVLTLGLVKNVNSWSYKYAKSRLGKRKI